MGDSGDAVHRRRRFDELYRANYPDMFRYVLRRMPAGSRADDAADTAAEVFTTAWRRIEKIPPPPEDRLWLYGVARKTVNRQLRGRIRRERLELRLQTEARIARVEGEAPTFEAPSFTEERVAVALAQLRSADREVIYLVLWDGLDNEQAGRVLGCSTNTVAVRLHRARARLSESTPVPSIEDNDVTGATKEI